MSVDLRTVQTRKRPLLHLLPYLTKYRRPIALGSLMVLLTNGAAVVFPWLLGLAVGALSRGASGRILAFYGAVIVGMSVVEGTFRYLMRSILIGVSRRIEYDLRNEVFERLQLLSPSFYQRNPTGEIMSRATNDLSAVRMVLGPGIMYSINTISTTALAVIVLLQMNVRLAALTLIPLLVVSYTVKRFGKKIHERFERIQEQLAALTSVAQENIAGVRVVKAYNQEAAFVERFGRANDEYLTRSLSLAKVTGLPVLAKGADFPKTDIPLASNE